MELAGSEINQKMRSAIKAKLTELGCYVDDELPDYVMVMVANKRTRSQMEDDLQLFLGGNTQLFVNWLHQVLKKLQEVSINTAPPNPPLNEDAKAAKSSSKEREKDKVKEKKDKKVSKEKDKHHKKSLRTIGSTKKSKKEAKKKEKARKKITRTHKSKKKSTDEMIRPNVPPLLMNLEKESEPSITDVFAGQILKNHGITLEQNSRMETKIDDVKPLRKALKRNRFPIIDPATVSNITEENSATTATVLLSETISVANSIESTSNDANELTPAVAHKTNINITSDLESLPINIKTNEINEIEAKIQGLKKKLADQLDSMSEDEDFLNIRTEAEELMNDLADDVLQEITATQNATSTPPLSSKPAPTANKPTPKTAKPTSKPAPARPEQDVLPVIELQLPKRPMRERLGVRPEREKRRSVERLTPEKEPQIDERSTSSVRSRLGETVEQNRKRYTSPRDDSQEKREETSSRRLLSKVSVLEVQRHGEERTARAGPASVVRVRPRPRLTVGAPAPSLLMRAVADAHKSLLSVPPKVDPEQSSVKKALVLPMRRNMDAQKIVIQVQSDRIPSPEHSDCEIDFDTESLADLESDVDKNSNEYVPDSIGKNSSHSAKYVPSHTSDSSIVDEETIKIHNPTVGGEKGPQFVVTLDGLDPNVFLAQKLKTEGITDEDLVLKSKKTTLEEQIKPTSTECNNISETKDNERRTVESNKSDSNSKPKDNNNVSIDSSSKNEPKHITTPKKTKTPTKSTSKALEKMSPENDSKATDSSNIIVKKESSPPAVKKRRASPIVFDVAVRERERSEKREKRERKESAGSDITVTTTASTHKYDSLPSLPPEKRKLPCRMFPACRFGADCAFSHPPCKFHSSCSRRDCIYSHPPATALVHAPQPVVASHVVPVSNYKCITPTALPSVCKFYPSCANPACHFLHPKPCRYGKACINKLECNFYHHEVNTNTKWRSPFKV